MAVTTADTLSKAGWEVIIAHHGDAEFDTQQAIKSNTLKVAVEGNGGGVRNRIIHRAFFDTTLFPLCLKSSTEVGGLDKALKAHKSNFDTKPDALILEDFESWNDSALKEVGDWSRRKEIPVFITLDSTHPSLSGDNLKKKLKLL